MSRDGDNQVGAEEAWGAELAASLDAEPELHPHLSALFEDLNDLGVHAHDVVALLKLGEVGSGFRHLDLGCGKGAVAHALAATFDAHVTGIDGVEDFVAFAQTHAVTNSLQHRCSFVVGDIHETVAELLESALGNENSVEIDDTKLFDGVSLLAMGDTFGGIEETLATLRACIRPGGILVFDDAIAPDGYESEDEWACLTRKESRATFSELGFDVVAELSTESERNRTWLREATSQVSKRAQELAVQFPANKGALEAFASRQRQETEAMADEEVEGILWLLRVPFA